MMRVCLIVKCGCITQHIALGYILCDTKAPALSAVPKYVKKIMAQHSPPSAWQDNVTRLTRNWYSE